MTLAWCCLGHRCAWADVGRQGGCATQAAVNSSLLCIRWRLLSTPPRPPTRHRPRAPTHREASQAKHQPGDPQTRPPPIHPTSQPTNSTNNTPVNSPTRTQISPPNIQPANQTFHHQVAEEVVTRMIDGSREDGLACWWVGWLLGWQIANRNTNTHIKIPTSQPAHTNPPPAHTNSTQTFGRAPGLLPLPPRLTWRHGSCTRLWWQRPQHGHTPHPPPSDSRATNTPTDEKSTHQPLGPSIKLPNPPSINAPIPLCAN